MLAVTYGLQVSTKHALRSCVLYLLTNIQALIFILHREFMLVGWMVVYILS